MTVPGAVTSDPVNAPLALEVVDLHKSFGELSVLAGVGLELRRGSVHALLGENGAGKSTLVKCVMGYHRPDRGRLLIDGLEVVVDRPQKAQALGVGMVYQHFTLVPNMTVAENLVLSRARLPLLLDWGRERAALTRFMSQGPFPLPLDTPVRMLAAGEKQKLEILKQLYLGSRIVILDEPTSVLTPQEADDVLGLMRRFTREANLSILLITHKFREVSQFADDVTVLRRGRVAGRGPAQSLDAPTLAEMMMGSRPAPGDGEGEGVTAIPPRRGAPVLRVDALTADDDLGLPALRGVSFDVHAGEIVGLAGIAGNGQEELVEVLGGQRASTDGRVLVGGRDYEGTRPEIIGRGVRCLPEDPLRNACVPGMTLAENLALRDFDRPPFTVGRWGLNRGRLQRRARAIIGEYQIRARGPEALMTELSGGNVQRTVLARELDEAAKLLIVANPCMGLDFRAVEEIHRRLRQARSRGVAILLVSADLDEILTLADRILVISEGKIVHQVTGERAEVGVIGQHMAGEKQIAHA